ncbi:MAG: ATP-dependent DNA helicase [Sphingomonas sanguinis]|jgi:ATP-dependent DNA helicase DinG|uniref:ATP-dependent DNA helicase n=1 Tax=Sphingomonas sanguinis TaxID=33051 RepID=A0A7Y7UR91_9SPHN|nr:ATP-dependent DNA helicase [Sphingomonas sanguinis]MBZ6381765.1 ATP-dependent DNA helicase [Sphingomonas sanguinis]NNG48369.1 ATP-dependent DNA helicase [Sphingomonas sanguinis]NNG53991.1 ATP-dependent DNA helicase [Sphingomonas sanguinis]NVP31065.1 ATP-dependent DNA helicase [Sphingomonas sanguinis]
MTVTALPHPALHASHSGVWISTGGQTRAVSRGEAIGLASETPVILLNAPLIGQRLGYADLSGLDILELFSFLRPAQFAVPTPHGLARACGLEPPENDADVAVFLLRATEKLLAMPDGAWPEREGAWTAAQSLARLRWSWAPLIGPRLTRPERNERWLFSALPEWEEDAPRPAPRTIDLPPQDSEERLRRLTGDGAEERPGQRAYAAAVTAAFAPRAVRDTPNMVLAEAGTGIGKTLGYLAPASLWAERAGGAVWISTYTKALQRQLSGETARIFPDAVLRKERVVTRKGRENYLCLLNLEDALQGGFAGRAAVLAQLVARWAAYTTDGDMVGGDLPGWLTTLFRRNGSAALTDRRGECVYAGCPHYRKCFIEHAARASVQADIVIANHALVMVNAARGRETQTRPTRYVFDEGHHLFDAADSMFATALTGSETIELRRWILGPEAGSRGRRRGLAARLSDVASYDEGGNRAIGDAVQAAHALASEGWLGRLAEGQPFGPIEALLAAVRGLAFARAEQPGDAGYGLETELADPSPALIEAAGPAAHALDALLRPLVTLGQRLEAVLQEAPDWLDGQARARVEGAIASIAWRAETVAAWLSLLARIGGPVDPDFVDWLAVDRVEGREYDIGLHRHWLDPTRPFAEIVLKPAHGALVTSATLRAGGDWDVAEARTGAPHLARGPAHFVAESPFDYPTRAEVLIVTDVKRGDIPQLANAYARLIAAAKGGTLGLFTAIRRLRGVHGRIADRLARDGLALHAQHVDPIDTGTLVDIFRDDPSASLLGTDALRDGVDVPGSSLRLVVMEGVPWPKPTVLHAARKLAGGGSAYDDRIVRARLAQAFGRLIRRADDRGAFVLLSAAMPSRLLDAFPPGVAISRVTLDEAVARVAGRLSSDAGIGHGGSDILPAAAPETSIR